MRNPSAVPAARPASFTSYKSGHNRSSPDDAGRLPRGGRLHFQAAESADALSRTQRVRAGRPARGDGEATTARTEPDLRPDLSEGGGSAADRAPKPSLHRIEVRSASIR